MEFNDAGVTIPCSKYDVQISYTGSSASFFSRGSQKHGDAVAAGFVIELSEDEFILCGNGYRASFLPKPGVPEIVGVLKKEEGYYQNNAWVPGRTLNGDEGYFIALSDFPQVQRGSVFSAIIEKCGIFFILLGTDKIYEKEQFIPVKFI